MFGCTAHYSLLIFPPGSNLMSMIFSLNSLIAITLHQPHCFQYKLHIGQVMERYSRGRLWHRSDSSLWSSDGNPACWGQCPRSLDILTGHCTFFWAGELYKSNGYRVVYRDNKNKLLWFLDVLVKMNNYLNDQHYLDLKLLRCLGISHYFFFFFSFCLLLRTLWSGSGTCQSNQSP